MAKIEFFSESVTYSTEFVTYMIMEKVVILPSEIWNKNDYE